MTTNELFEVSDDDRIPWWTPGCRMRFSEMCKRQLRKFRAMYEEAGSRRSSVRRREKDVYRILTETTHRFGRVYAFEPFVEESLSDLNAPETRAMWRVLQELIDDRELLDQAEVIFKPGEPHIRDLGDPLGGMSNYKSIWEGIPLSERKNPGRMTIRRYLALVGNRALREKVLGC